MCVLGAPLMGARGGGGGSIGTDRDCSADRGWGTGQEALPPPQVYTKDRQLYTFHNFAGLAAVVGSTYLKELGTTLERAYNYLDHVWRAATPVPAQG